MRVPICVKSPDVIIKVRTSLLPRRIVLRLFPYTSFPPCISLSKHHKITLVYLIAPVFFRKYAWFMGAVLSVEINTWFLILRRVIYKSKVHPIISETVSFCFYATWIAIRCIVYPFVFFDMIRLYVEKVQETGIFFHLPMVVIPVHMMLCLLNLKWTYDLFCPIVKRWVNKDAEKPSVSTGL